MITGQKLFFAIIIMVAVTFFTRLVPFILFDKEGKRPPEIVLYLGKFLPPAIISCILVYCFQDINLFIKPFGLREILSALVVSLLYIIRKNAMLSIILGTCVYIFLTNVFYAI